MPAPGPSLLGRAVIVSAGSPPPPPWGDARRIVVDDSAAADPAEVVGALHEAWTTRAPVVIELALDPAGFRAPQRLLAPPWELGPSAESWADRLHFLVWANSYDARGDGEPVWWWSRKAARLGATEGG